ncbi:unnamed protein product [Dicrocoelium dendriticum]|nr:unnamed protein product [Dicrocoelium dendriticum]
MEETTSLLRLVVIRATSQLTAPAFRILVHFNLTTISVYKLQPSRHLNLARRLPRTIAVVGRCVSRFVSPTMYSVNTFRSVDILYTGPVFWSINVLKTKRTKTSEKLFFLIFKIQDILTRRSFVRSFWGILHVFFYYLLYTPQPSFDRLARTSNVSEDPDASAGRFSA